MLMRESQTPKHADNTAAAEPIVQPIVASKTSSAALQPPDIVPPLATAGQFGHRISSFSVHASGHGMLQTRLAVSQPGDPYEQEADRVADQVMHMAAPPSPAASDPSSPHGVQEEDRPHEPSGAATTGVLHRTAAEGDELLSGATSREAEEEPLQAQSQPGQTPTVTPALEAQIQALRGGGEPLSPAVRSFMEPRFGHDFGQVRVHTDERAARSAQAVGALAYTVGHDVAFARGQYAPDTQAGQKLLAHELTHVVQQRGGCLACQAKKDLTKETSTKWSLSQIVSHEYGGRAVAGGGLFELTNRSTQKRWKIAFVGAGAGYALRPSKIPEAVQKRLGISISPIPKEAELAKKILGIRGQVSLPGATDFQTDTPHAFEDFQGFGHVTSASAGVGLGYQVGWAHFGGVDVTNKGFFSHGKGIWIGGFQTQTGGGLSKLVGFWRLIGSSY